VIAEPLSPEDRPQLESSVAPRPIGEPVIEQRPAEASPLTMARVTSSLQLILAARRAARVTRDVANS